jgi:hypothetical protein
MDVTSVCGPTDFARKVLWGVSAIEVPRSGETDRYPELGLSLWMRQTGTGPRDAGPAMLAMRAALLSVSGLDHKSETIPLPGVDPGVDVVNPGVS